MSFISTCLVKDENDNSPQFTVSSLASTVLENALIGSFVEDFEVLDIDHGLAALSNFSLNGTNAER